MTPTPEVSREDEDLLILQTARFHNLRLAGTTDLDQATVNSGTAARLVRQGRAVLIEETKRSNRYGGQFQRFMVITAAGRAYVDEMTDPTTPPKHREYLRSMTMSTTTTINGFKIPTTLPPAAKLKSLGLYVLLAHAKYHGVDAGPSTPKDRILSLLEARRGGAGATGTPTPAPKSKAPGAPSLPPKSEGPKSEAPRLTSTITTPVTASPGKSTSPARRTVKLKAEVRWGKLWTGSFFAETKGQGSYVTVMEVGVTNSFRGCPVGSGTTVGAAVRDFYTRSHLEYLNGTLEERDLQVVETVDHRRLEDKIAEGYQWLCCTTCRDYLVMVRVGNPAVPCAACVNKAKEAKEAKEPKEPKEPNNTSEAPGSEAKSGDEWETRMAKLAKGLDVTLEVLHADLRKVLEEQDTQLRALVVEQQAMITNLLGRVKALEAVAEVLMDQVEALSPEAEEPLSQDHVADSDVEEQPRDWDAGEAPTPAQVSAKVEAPQEADANSGYNSGITEWRKLSKRCKELKLPAMGKSQELRERIQAEEARRAALPVKTIPTTAASTANVGNNPGIEEWRYLSKLCRDHDLAAHGKTQALKDRLTAAGVDF